MRLETLARGSRNYDTLMPAKGKGKERGGEGEHDARETDVPWRSTRRHT